MKRIIATTLSIALLCVNSAQANWFSAVSSWCAGKQPVVTPTLVTAAVNTASKGILSGLKNHPVIAATTAAVVVGGSIVGAYVLKSRKGADKKAKTEAQLKVELIASQDPLISKQLSQKILEMNLHASVYVQRKSVPVKDFFEQKHGKKLDAVTPSTLKKAAKIAAYSAPVVAVGVTYACVPAVRNTVNKAIPAVLAKVWSVTKAGAHSIVSWIRGK